MKLVTIVCIYFLWVWLCLVSVFVYTYVEREGERKEEKDRGRKKEEIFPIHSCKINGCYLSALGIRVSKSMRTTCGKVLRKEIAENVV